MELLALYADGLLIVLGRRFNALGSLQLLNVPVPVSILFEAK